ncbi:MAG TPA: PH domain-containing protein, partial [Planctomycetaceae bacterium]|nr:PH domain-containing protein [Planctomycetaceae bacterium]
SLYFAIKALIVFLTTECVLTDRRVLAKTGLISRESIELLLTKVEGLQVKQGLLGRIFNFGSVIITGTGGSTSPFSGIAQPLDFRKRVQEQIAEAQH